MIIVGLLALAGWAWALWLAFYPVQLGGDGGVESQQLSCQPRAFFQESSFIQSIRDTWDNEIARNIAAECPGKNDAHLRRALGVAILAAPLGVLWLWGEMVLRTGAKAAQPAAAE
ncbi:hypothetical protein ACFYOD_17110 [Streptomyces sp. NPDC006703]|uniref:hypothetical protein n=1 Tax=Streptomyces sp. NPDC006703 TaxID=3364759 RepID=UPI003690CE6C